MSNERNNIIQLLFYNLLRRMVQIQLFDLNPVGVANVSKEMISLTDLLIRDSNFNQSKVAERQSTNTNLGSESSFKNVLGTWF